jgi:hypothetical protein
MASNGVLRLGDRDCLAAIILPGQDPFITRRSVRLGVRSSDEKARRITAARRGVDCLFGVLIQFRRWLLGGIDGDNGHRG